MFTFREARVLLLLLLCLLTACGASQSGATTSGGETATPDSQGTTIPFVIARGAFQEFALPQAGSGLMRPAIDAEGRVWFGEMGKNYLADFDPRSRTFEQIKPPRGMFGIMGIEVAPDDTVWFAEQYANYIGHYFPATKRFQVYPLPSITAPDPSNASKTLRLPSAPNDLAFDASGNVWFTELNASAIGRLDPKSGVIRQYVLAAGHPQSLNPYGIVVDAHGIVWFTEAATSRIGRLDPASGAIRYYTLLGAATPLMEIVSDPRGMIWATSFAGGVIVSLDPTTGAIERYSIAAPDGGGVGSLYGIAAPTANEVWLSISSSGVIARLDVLAHRLTYYVIPTSGSLPLGLAVGANRAVWFTEAGSNKIGMLLP